MFFPFLLPRFSAPPRCGSLHPPYRASTEPYRVRTDGAPTAPTATTDPNAALGTIRRSEGHSAGHDHPRGRSDADEQRRGPRGRSRERSTLTRVRPSRRPTPSEIRDRFMRLERSRSRERSTLSRLSSRRSTTSLQHREACHTPGYSTEPEQRSQSHSQSQNILNASKIPQNARTGSVSATPLVFPMCRQLNARTTTI